MNKLISVIMPSYNHGKYIHAAIMSVLQQTYTAIEMIIVDNYSTDNTKELVAGIDDSRVKFFQYHNNGSIAAARNHGVKQASGDILAFIDSDDIWLPNKLSDQVSHLEADKIVAVASNFLAIGDVQYANNTLKFGKNAEYLDIAYTSLILDSPAPTSSYLLHKQAFNAAGGFDEGQDIICLEDWDLWLRLCQYGFIRVLAKPLVQYRIIKNKDRDIRKVAKAALIILQRQYRHKFLTRGLYLRAVGNRSLYIAKSCLDVHDRSGIKYCAKAFLYAEGLKKKAKAVLMMLLFCLPRVVKTAVVEKLYRLRYVWSTK